MVSLAHLMLQQWAECAIDAQSPGGFQNLYPAPFLPFSMLALLLGDSSFALLEHLCGVTAGTGAIQDQTQCMCTARCIYNWDLMIAPAVATHSCPLGGSLCTHCSDLSSPSTCSLYTYFKSPRLFLSSLRYSCFSRTYWLLIFATKGSGFPSSSWRKLQAC